MRNTDTDYREIRGGAWDTLLNHRTMPEAYETPESSDHDLGFRVFYTARMDLVSCVFQPVMRQLT